MSKGRKQILNEGQVRKFMKFANIKSEVSDRFLSEMYQDDSSEGLEEDCDDLEEGCGDPEVSGGDVNLQEAGGMEPEEPLEDEGAELGDEEEMDLGDEELPEPDAGADAAEVTITPEQLDVIVQVLDQLVAAQGGDAGEEDLGDEEEMDLGDEEDLDMGGEEDLDMGGEEGPPEEEPMMESVVNKIAKRVAKRLMKERKLG